MLLPDHEIRRLCDPDREEWKSEWIDEGYYACSESERVLLPGPHPVMIAPFSEGVSGNGVISYGLSHAGYDLRLGSDILVFKNTSNIIIDPKRFGDDNYRRSLFEEVLIIQDKENLTRYKRYVNGYEVITMHSDSDNSIIIPPHGYILGRSLEYLRIPRHLKGRCVGKSTYARCGIIANLTPLEPGWEGHLTLEIANATPCPAAIFVGEGVAQLEFETLTSLPEKDYGDKRGQYQGQIGVTPAKVKGS